MSKTNVVRKSLKTLFVLLALIHQVCAAPSPKEIAVTQFVEHVAADAVREGLLEELKKRGYSENENLTVTFENAQGNAATAGQIARKFLGLKPDAIIAITTPSAQAMVKVIGNESIPIVFSAVTNPVEAGLVKSIENHKGKVTGVRDTPPIKDQMAFIKKILPETKNLGVLYNPGDSGSVSSLKTIREQADINGFNLIESTPVKSADIQSAVLQLVGKVDAIYIPLDNMIVSAMDSVASLALKHNLPIFAADSGSVKSGALACLGYSYQQVGSKTGEIVSEILEGKDPSEIAIASPSITDIFINRNTLEKLKITLPDAVRTQAHYY